MIHTSAEQSKKTVYPANDSLRLPFTANIGEMTFFLSSATPS